MATFTFPSTVRPSKVDWQLLSNAQAFKSPLSGVIQTLELPGAAWVATLTFENLKRSEIAELEVLIMRSRGMSNRVWLYDHFREIPRGTGLGSPRVAGAGQTGTSLNTQGWTANQVGALLTADRFSVNGELKAVITSVDVNASGLATLQFEPPLRYSPADNATITIHAAPAKMMLIDNSQGKLSTSRSLTATALTYIEDIA